MPELKTGFIQGRLSPIVDGKIQAFPAEHWREEFALAPPLGLSLLEWTLDQEGLHDNPLLTEAGRTEILDLCGSHGIGVETVTGDCFMQAPFYKASGSVREGLMADFRAVISAMAGLGGGIIVFPLVDNGRLDNESQEAALLEGLAAVSPLLEAGKVRVAFESDFEPEPLKLFIRKLPSALFGVNYDIGNSASLGYDASEELAAYGDRVINVHVKDRVLGGTTVPLGQGDADFSRVFAALRQAKYDGPYILQTARAGDGDHARVLGKYVDMVRHWHSEAGPET